MESLAGRKRPWEDENPSAMHTKRRGSTSAATPVTPSPLPPQAGYYSRNNEILDQRRLPPLHTSASTSSAEVLASHAEHLSFEAHPTALLTDPRPRSQSLFNLFRSSHWRDSQHDIERPIRYPPTSESDTYPSSLPVQGNESHFGPGLAPHATGALKCCSSSCKGQACSSIRILMRKLAAEVTLLESKVQVITQTERQTSDQPVDTESLNTSEALQHALLLVKWSNLSFQAYLDCRPPPNPERRLQPDGSPSMRRGQHYLEEREEQSPQGRQYPSTHHGYHPQPAMVTDDGRRHFQASEVPSIGNSPHHTASPSGSAYVPPQSPMQAPQAMRTAILPSPSSLNFPNVQTLPSTTPPSTAAQTSAQSAHLQDLQHQISVKTLAFQTLQREYDSLLQKLERQRAKCATLEKKFEVSDVEINSLTDEKEKLQAQIAILENQVEDLQQSRDEARRQLVANGAQYMRIMEMANRLQAQGAEDKKKWEAEKTGLEQRIRLLEEAMVSGSEHNQSEAEPIPSASYDTSSLVSQNRGAASSSQSETINVLRAEVARLRSRTQTLETALQTMRRESISIQAAAQQLVESGSRLEGVARSTGGSDG